jgi:hypothetical protein
LKKTRKREVEEVKSYVSSPGAGGKQILKISMEEFK